jgi:hypothetical protein
VKTLLVLIRIIAIGLLWSIIFIEGVRVIMLENWRFDIFWPPHWLHAWNLWLSGWVIDTAKEWAFVLILLAFIPLWLTGWIALSLLPWEVWIYKLLISPVVLAKRIFNPLQIVPVKAPVVIKKKSYKEIRPTGPRTPIYDYSDSGPAVVPAKTPAIATSLPAADTSSQANRNDLKQKATEARQTFDHAVFDFGDDDEDFDLDFDSFEQSDIFKVGQKTDTPQETAPSVSEPYTPVARSSNDRTDSDRNAQNRANNKNNRDKRKTDTRSENDKNRQTGNRGNRTDSSTVQRPNNPVADVLLQKGYDLISSTTIQNIMVDFIGVSDDKICLCLIDKETGDWLADEERFNNEEPLWFSESSHRISPVRKADIVRQSLEKSLDDADFQQELQTYVIIQSGNIINAEDMFETWNNMNILVTRINRGSPKEINLFSKTVEEAESKLDRTHLNELKKLLKTIN